MPRYAPLPRVQLDPRSEAELVAAAARRVYEASSSTLNDFSSGSPIMALLEGQSFAQAEFLQFANQFPESVLTEWVGPFLGAQRRTGAGAQVDVTFSISGQDQTFEIFAGYQLGTDPNLTGGDSVRFVTLERLTIPKGSVQGTVRAIAVETGTKGNIEPDTITRTLTSLAGVTSVTNKEAAFGGQDAELLSEVKERFFSLIRRRNPVSAEDWTDWFSDALGPGAVVSVLARHSEKGIYQYDTGYIRSNPSVAFFVLNPDGTPINAAQIAALETLMKWSLPIEFMGYIYPMEVNDVDIDITLDYDPSKSYSQNLESLSSTLRSSLFSVLTPNAVFPIDYQPSVLDLQNGLTATFPITLGVGNRFTDPNISEIKAYYQPTDMGISTFLNTAPLEFKTGSRVKENDLIVEYSGTEPYFYPALSDFDPDNNDTVQYVNNDKLDVQIIKEFTTGFYNAGEVVSYPVTNNLHVVLTPFFYSNRDQPQTYLNNNSLSAAKSFSSFAVGETINYDADGTYDPDIVPFEPDDISNTIYVPATPADAQFQSRVGYPVYVAKANFVVENATSTLGNVQTQGLVDSTFIQVQLLTDDNIYSQGDFVKSPNLAEVASAQVTTDTCYLTEAEGLKEVYFRVAGQFGFFLTDDDIGFTDRVETLVLEGLLEPVNVISFSSCGRSTFDKKPFRYSTRFKLGEYVRYREQGGFDADELQSCFDASAACANVSEGCSTLIGQNLTLPRYFFAKRDFTPDSTDLQTMMDSGVIEEVDSGIFATTYKVELSADFQAYPVNITQAMIGEGLISVAADLVDGDSVEVITPEGQDRGVWRYGNNTWTLIMPGIPKYRDMFRYAPGDIASFRQESTVKSYVAKTWFTPVLSPEVYIKNGLLEATEISTSTVDWIDPTYNMEDIVFDEINGAFSFYRVTKPTTPDPEILAWNTQTIANTPRVQELVTKFQKIVSRADCGERILSRLRNQASSIKLGVANFKFKSKDSIATSNQFVWESTQYANQVPSVSYSPTISNWDYKPTDYGNGTLGL